MVLVDFKKSVGVENFVSIKVGDTFMISGDYGFYLKVSELTDGKCQKKNAIDLATAQHCHFNLDALVYPRDCEVHVKGRELNA